MELYVYVDVDYRTNNIVDRVTVRYVESIEEDDDSITINCLGSEIVFMKTNIVKAVKYKKKIPTLNNYNFIDYKIDEEVIFNSKED